MGRHFHLPWMKSFIIGTFILILLVIACGSSEFAGQYFSFPPGSKPHEDNWQYTAMVMVTTKHRPITDKSRKKVTIKVYDRNNTSYLTDDYEFESASIKANANWEKFEELKIELEEVGNEYASDAYNRQLLKTGPIKLASLAYKYNQEVRRFQRINMSEMIR